MVSRAFCHCEGCNEQRPKLGSLFRWSLCERCVLKRLAECGLTEDRGRLIVSAMRDVSRAKADAIWEAITGEAPQG